MKKLIFLIFILFLWGCGSYSGNPEMIDSESDSAFREETFESFRDTSFSLVFDFESINYSAFQETIKDSKMNEEFPQDSQKKELKIVVERDTSKSKKSLDVSQLDTSSILPDLRKNKEILQQQQKTLDSLIKKK